MTDAISLDNPRLEPIWMTFVDLDDPHCIYPNFVCRDAPLSEANKIAFAGGNAEKLLKISRREHLQIFGRATKTRNSLAAAIKKVFIARGAR